MLANNDTIIIAVFAVILVKKRERDMRRVQVTLPPFSAPLFS